MIPLQKKNKSILFMCSCFCVFIVATTNLLFGSSMISQVVTSFSPKTSGLTTTITPKNDISNVVGRSNNDHVLEDDAPVLTSTNTPSSTFLLPELLRKYNSSHYTWVGNHFIPPKNVPMFRPIDYRNYFKNRNTLFIGDSTARRSYASLYAIMNSTTPYDIPLPELDHTNVIDFNKPGHHQIEHCSIEDRGLFNILPIEYKFVCRNIVLHDSDRKNTAGKNGTSRHGDETGKFDYYLAGCFKDLPYEYDFNSTLFQDYDLIVIAAGIWEALRKDECDVLKTDTATNVTDAEIIIEKMELVYGALGNASSPSLQFVFRTPGFDHRGDSDDTVWKMVNHIKDQYSSFTTTNSTSKNNNNRQEEPLDETTQQDAGVHNQYHDTSQNNVTVVDWGTVISKRSHGDLRIVGDLNPHYGFEARLLFAQQLLHELIAASST